MMARPYFTARHLESMSLLPDTLEIGRAYFVDDEQVIVIDHGRGPVVYGKAPGPQGIAGEPIPQLQDQIDALVTAELTTQKTIWDINKREVERTEQTALRISEAEAKHDSDIQALSESMAANLEHSDADTQAKFEYVKELTAHNAGAITSLIATIHDQFQKYDSALNILAKSVAELYPEHYASEDSQDDPLDNETVTTDAGTWTIQQTTLKDGTVVLNLEAQELVIDRIKIGDSVDFDGSTWTVEDVSTEGGVTSITIRP